MESAYRKENAMRIKIKSTQEKYQCDIRQERDEGNKNLYDAASILVRSI